MPLINFKEIPRANTGEGNQDTFELFARDLLTEIGYQVIEEPARGADSGKDLIIQEKRTGIGGETDFRWLVSCKHFAHNNKGKKGQSVTPADEENILDRVKSKNCDGFIGFYSTVASESLMNTFRGLSRQIGYQTFDSEKIESLIVGYRERENLFLRYFPNSYKVWKDLYYYTEPVKLFKSYLKHSKYYDTFLDEIMKFTFTSLENAIKPIRVSESLEELFKIQNKTIVVDPIAGHEFVKRIKQIEDGDFFQEIKRIQEEIIPSELKESENINIFPRTFQGFYMRLNTNEEELRCTFFYPNHILITGDIHEKLQKLFIKLKDMLTG